MNATVRSLLQQSAELIVHFRHIPREQNAVSDGLANRAIDKYCQDNNVKCIDFIKIDVEGAEYRVLKGAENMLKKKLIKSGIFETGETLTDAKVSEKQLMEYLEEYGYILQKIPNNCIFWC